MLALEHALSPDNCKNVTKGFGIVHQLSQNTAARGVWLQAKTTVNTQQPLNQLRMHEGKCTHACEICGSAQFTHQQGAPELGFCKACPIYINANFLLRKTMLQVKMMYMNFKTLPTRLNFLAMFPSCQFP